MHTAEPLEFIAPMPRLTGDGAQWIRELCRLEKLGFDIASISHHVAKGWQLAPIPTMAFAAAATTDLRILSLVMQNPMQHPALLARDIATIDRLSDGRIELGIGVGWMAEDYAALGIPFQRGRDRVSQLEEALVIITQYFASERVTFTGSHYAVADLEALPRCTQQPRPPILIGAGGPRMLDLAGRYADIVALHPSTPNGTVDEQALAQLAIPVLEKKIDRVRRSADHAGRPDPALQISCLHVDVTDSEKHPHQKSTWADSVAAQMDSLHDSPVALVGTAAECAAKIVDCSRRLGIRRWHLGHDVDAASSIIAHIRQGGR